MTTSSVPELTPSEAYAFILRALACKEVPYIGGPAAIGKSQIVAKAANDLDAVLIDVRLSQMLSEDLSGIPERNERGRPEYMPFEIFPLEDAKLPDGKQGWIIFLDELPSASEEVLAATYSLILDRTLGGKTLHPRCMLVAAGNRSTDSAIARELPDTLITRMLPINMKPSTDDWVKWAKTSKNKNSTVIELIEKKPDLLYAPIAAADRAENESFANPRGWEKVMKVINLHEKTARQETKEKTDSAGLPVDDDNDVSMPALDVLSLQLMTAAVGAIAAQSAREFYNETLALPTPWEVAQAPSSTNIPGNHAGKAKLAGQLGQYFLTSDESTRGNLMKFMNRVGGEYSELVRERIKNGRGQTASDKRLVNSIGERLNIDPLLGGTVSTDSPDSFTL